MRKKIVSVILILIVILLTTGVHEKSNYAGIVKLEDGIVELGFFGALGTKPSASENGDTIIYRYRYWLIGVGLLMIFGTLWIVALNYLVQSRTKALFETNEQLIHSQSQNKAIINAIPDGIFLLDNDTRILECKIEGYDTLFSKRSDMMMRRLSDIMPVPYGEKLLRAIHNISRINELNHLDLEINFDGAPKYFEMRIIRSGKNEVIALVRDMTIHYENLENIKYLSYHDQLTGLFNRHMFEEELERLDVNRNTPLSVIMADVNGLKLINDCFGHPTGDKLLIMFSEMLKKVFRADDIVCRLGGDEFVVILPHTTHNVTQELIKRVKAACDEVEFYNLSLSVAFGSATKTATSDSIVDVMKYAEDQMYKSKLFEAPKIKEKMVSKLLESLFKSSDAEALHAETVETNSALIGNAIGLNQTEMETLKVAAKYHDIGKIAIDHKLLYKSEPLSPNEIETIRTHPDIGYRILSAVNEMAECADIVLSHHERWDGEGYPKGLSGDDIPLMSRIISIADVYSIITQKAYYKDVMTPLEAIEEIKKHSGTQFDPILTRKFVALMKDKM